jgi:hypothetical protein
VAVFPRRISNVSIQNFRGIRFRVASLPFSQFFFSAWAAQSAWTAQLAWAVQDFFVYSEVTTPAFFLLSHFWS